MSRFAFPLSAMIAVALVVVACAPRSGVSAGRALYNQNCVACHGSDARGGDTIPDLTGIAARAGGTYPQMMVLDKLDGYARGQAAYEGVQMPVFGDLLIGPLARVETRQGMTREIPEKIIALEAYLRSIQR